MTNQDRSITHNFHMALCPLPPGNTALIISSSYYFPNFKEPRTTWGVTTKEHRACDLVDKSNKSTDVARKVK